MTVSTLAAPLRRVAPESLAQGVRRRLDAARARRALAAAQGLGDHRLDLELAVAARRAHESHH